MENEIFSVDEIKKFVDYFSAGEFNQFAYVIIDKAFNLHPEEERVHFREQCLTSIEKFISKIEIPKEATDLEKANAAASIAGQLLVVINDMIVAGEFVMPSKEK
jgi:hypothetical protein